MTQIMLNGFLMVYSWQEQSLNIFFLLLEWHFDAAIFYNGGVFLGLLGESGPERCAI